MPPGLSIRRSNNNVDLIRFGGEYYMAFRTAPTHFASRETRLAVLRSPDGDRWQEEMQVHFSRDLREPRFFAFKGKLFFCFFDGGTQLLKFEPNRIHVCERAPDGRWTEPRPVFRENYVVWRVKTRGDTAYMSVYYGRNLYGKGDEGEVRLLRSTDGYDWEPISDAPQIADVGAEEGEFEFDADGNLVALVREEVHGGTLVCTAPKEDLTRWETRFTPYKVDSALLFRRGEDFYVLGRRNVAGPCWRGPSFLPESVQNAWSLVTYSLTRKRTALYKVNRGERTLTPLFDLPSKGDTAFPGLAARDEHSYWLVNYSSPLEGLDWPWVFGQLLRSHLYRMQLSFAEPAPVQ